MKIAGFAVIGQTVNKITNNNSGTTGRFVKKELTAFCGTYSESVATAKGYVCSTLNGESREAYIIDMRNMACLHAMRSLYASGYEAIPYEDCKERLHGIVNDMISDVFVHMCTENMHSDWSAERKYDYMKRMQEIINMMFIG